MRHDEIAQLGCERTLTGVQIVVRQDLCRRVPTASMASRAEIRIFSKD